MRREGEGEGEGERQGRGFKVVLCKVVIYSLLRKFISVRFLWLREVFLQCILLCNQQYIYLSG